MAKIAKSITELIGNTPLLELKQISRKFNLETRVIAKLEYLNPGRSVKDRLGFALIDVADGKIMPVPGGVLIRDAENNLLGAVGISGDISDQDERCAIAGIEAVGFFAGI